MHFPFQLAIVGVVEGSQQLALARYTIKNAHKVETSIMQYCEKEMLDGGKLRDKLMTLLAYFELDTKKETTTFYKESLQAIYKIGNETGICAAGKAAGYEDSGWPMEFRNVSASISNGIYVGLGMKIPTKKLDEFEPIEIAFKAWELVYMYYWSCFCVLILCLIIFLFLIRRHKADLFDYTSVISRTIVLGVSGALLGLWAKKEALYEALATPMLLPICVILMFLIMVSDKLSSIFCNWRLKKTGQPYALEVEEHEHGHGGGHEAHGHGEVHETEPLHGHGHHDSVNLEDARKSAHYSVQTGYTDAAPFTTVSTEYKSQHDYSVAALASPPLTSPPLMSPPLMSPDPSTPGMGAKPQGPGGYMPVSSGQNYGA